MLVYVINKNGNKLMPCKPAKARKLLKDGKAHVAKLTPFTIQLNWDCEENVQEVTVGIDKGSHETGLSCIGNGKILLSGVIKHRLDVKKKMDCRRGNRAARRSRKWYREPRFNNRSSSKRSGRIPPSVKTNVEEVIRVINKLPLPISSIIVEDVLIDIARLNDESLHGKDYQKSTRLDQNLRLATLMRDDFKCTQCKANNTKLEAHHIVWREHGGKDSITNLTTLCSSCHKKVHAGKIIISTGASGFKDRIAQRTMQGKTYMYSNLGTIAPVTKVFGYQTTKYRNLLGLPKEHDSDSLCIATMLNAEVVPYDRDNFYNISFRARQNRRQYHILPRKGKGRVKYQVNEELEGFHKGDIVKVREKHIRRIKAIFSDRRFEFYESSPKHSIPKYCKLLQKSPTVVWGNA
jgi:hypothetical protein